MHKGRTIIGKGHVATVYTDGIFAYKVFNETHPQSWIRYEVEIQHVIKTNTSLPMVSYKLDELNREIQMDLIQGITLRDRMRKEKYKDGFKDMMMLQEKIYTYHDLSLPDAYPIFEERIRSSKLDAYVKEKALQSLFSIEKMQTLCHFDFHPENIMFSNNAYVIIDWVNAKLAHPALDLARTYVIMKQYMSRQAMKYLREITTRLHIDIQKVYQVIPAMAALRWIEVEDKEFKETLIKLIEDGING